ncbi:sigma-70 family RNA polymerase sigma factor [Paenibacillus sp. TRM 82003]|nr:sigma-70 family RNA polymerase sigma factor [Paenibacillus sp. TRM 82003]
MDEHGDALLRTAVLLLGDDQTAEEVVQDTFVQAFYKIGQLKEPERLKAWLTRIAIHQCRARQRTWNWRRLLPFERMEPMLTESDSGAEERYFEMWRGERLREAIAGLDYDYREVITLYYYHEWSVGEIAEQLSCNVNTVKARLARGRGKLRAHITTQSGGEEDVRA